MPRNRVQKTPKRSEEMIQRAIALVNQGQPLEAVARAHDIPSSTLRNRREKAAKTIANTAALYDAYSGNRVSKHCFRIFVSLIDLFCFFVFRSSITTKNRS